MSFELIVGIYSIDQALRNPARDHQELVTTEEGWKEFLKKTQLDARKLLIQPRFVSPHLLQEQAKQLYKELELEYMRVPSHIYLVTSPLETYDVAWLKDKMIDYDNFRILALDQVSDVNNGAAILRTASFFGIGALVVPQARSFGLTPSFYRIASGAAEHIPLIRTNNLSRTLGQLKEEGVLTLGLSEHADKPITAANLSHSKLCLVLGAEDDGLSNAVMRSVDYTLSLTPQGAIKSLNVSAAAAVAMQMCFGLKV